jgi:hypothetical protein
MACKYDPARRLTCHESRPLVTVAVRCLPVAHGPDVAQLLAIAPDGCPVSRLWRSGLRDQGLDRTGMARRSSRLWMMLLLAALAVVMLLLKDIVVGVA